MPTLGILVGGGPAPGINSVIGTAAIHAINNGWKVIGIRNGYQYLANGDTSKTSELTIEAVSRIHLLGGSVLGTSRENPTKSKERLDNVVNSLKKLGITYLVSIGGDDTAFSASKVAEASQGAVKVCHVPKTIDNDLPLPDDIPTFGYETARQVGFEITKNMMEDAKTASRWYFLVAMGRTAGHLALGIGKSAGATVTITAEEFENASLKGICDVLEGSIVKRLAAGRVDGVAIIAEGIAIKLNADEVEDLKNAERDKHGHIRLSEVDLGKVIKKELAKRLKNYSQEITIVNKNIGYELRCAAPVPFDIEYTRNLGCSAVNYLKDGGSGSMITMQRGKFVPIKFEDMRDPETGKTMVRLLDTKSESFKVALNFMIRLNKSDFEAGNVKALADAAGMTEEAFNAHFADLKASL